MPRELTFLIAGGAAAVVMLTGCGGGVVRSAELDASYRDALDRTAPMAARFEPGSEAEAAALERLEGFFARLGGEGVEARAAAVYAPEAYFNDTLTAIEGGEEIAAYLAATAERAESITVDFQDVAKSGIDYYVRWEMTMQVPSLEGGEPLDSFGVSQFRFDESGRVLLHKDFWDSGSGLFEYLPVTGWLIPRMRGQLEH